MSFHPNEPKAVEIPLSAFGSLVTELNPSDVPFGLSPDNADVAYTPGNVSTRPGLHGEIPAFPAGGPNNQVPSSNYAKSYKSPDGTYTNLFLDSNGALWKKNVNKVPLNRIKLLDSTPFSYAKSVTAFGREYIAISDGNLGQEMPLQFDGTNLDRFTQDGPGNPPQIASLALPPTVIASIARAGNGVTVTTTAPHSLQNGYQAQVSDTPPTQTGGPIVLIKIDNEESPGIATVVMTTPHGLTPGVFVTLDGVSSTVVGGGNVSIKRAGQILTVETLTPHGLTPGAVVTLFATGTPSFDTTFTVAQVTSPTTYVTYQVGPDLVGGGGNTQVNWPIPNTATPKFFEVVAAPSPLNFQVAVNYSDGLWSGGTVSHSWDGTFHVSDVTATTFKYQQYGPDATGAAGGGVTPYGQAAPGKHQCRVSFLTRNGSITSPSPPIPFIANGGQYIRVTDLPIGPPNTVARILQFTGAEGADFFCIPVPAQINGQQVSTATQINDNTSATATLDFSDNTLFAATATSIPGNDLASQISIDGALGFGLSGSRLITCGQRNRVQNLLNMGFDGGHLPSTPTKPTGWTSLDGNGALVAGRLGQAWQITVPADGGPHGILSQSLYADAYGAPIAHPNTKYRFRCWLKVSIADLPGLRFEAQIASPSTGYSSVAIFNFNLSATGAWMEADFPIPTPGVIPVTDFVIEIYAVSTITPATVTVDEMSMVYVDNPTLDTLLYGSYVNNPEGIDGVSGKFGPSDDVHKVMTMGIIRSNLYLLTQDPGGRIHAVVDNGITEPAGWQINEVASQCGALSAFCLTQSQLDDSTASGGEEWFAWASVAGARIFNGSEPWKISQEIQPTWDAMNPNGYLFIWALNNPTKREMYFGIPATPVLSLPSPSAIFVMNYALLDGAYQIGVASPMRAPTSDEVRKWTIWHRPMNGAAILYLAEGFTIVTRPVFLSGNNGGTITGPGFGRVYSLQDGLLTDDDYGHIDSYYTTHFFVPPELEGALRLGSHMKMLSYLTAIVSGVGNLSIVPLINKLTRAWALNCQRVLGADPDYDLEWSGGSASGQRIAFRVSVAPLAGTDNYFSLSRFVPSMKANTHLPVRGVA